MAREMKHIKCFFVMHHYLVAIRGWQAQCLIVKIALGWEERTTTASLLSGHAELGDSSTA